MSRRGRISRSAEFERVYRHGRSHSNRYLVLYSFPRDTVPAPAGGSAAGSAHGGPHAAAAVAADRRLGVSVSRKVGGAVERNRVKRLLREAFAALAEGLPPGHDVVIVARPEARELAEREGLGGVRSALGELVAKAGGPTGARR